MESGNISNELQILTSFVYFFVIPNNLVEGGFKQGLIKKCVENQGRF